MSSTITASCVELTVVDLPNNRNAYYRIYEIGTWLVLHYGKTGSAGQWKSYQLGSPSRVRIDAHTKRGEKEAKGYIMQARWTFDMAGDLNYSLPSAREQLTRARLAAQRDPATSPPAPIPSMPVQTPTPVPEPVAAPLQDIREEFDRKVLSAIALAATDRDAAIVELALLNEQWSGLQQAHAKSASYLETLSRMIFSVPATVSL